MIKVCPTCQQKYPEDTEFCAQDGTRLKEMQDEGGDALIGRVLDSRWVIEDQIGEGGMGAVYLASQRSVDRKVAIKTLRPELCNSREFVDRFFREARVASNIAHPHCVTILDFGQTDDGILFLAMEYLEGMPLTHRLRHPDMTVREIVQICMQIASALAAAHDGNIIHRDLKPDNVFLLSISDGSTFIKVLDFGIAKDTSADDQMTKTGQVFGTPEYMSPEQCRGDKIDGRSDLYSLGCILYRMLGGHPPFESDTPMAVLVSHVSEQPRHVRELINRADVPDGLIELCMQLLEKNPDNRPPDAQAVRSHLERILGNSSTGATPVIGSPAQSDDHVSGPTLGTDSAELVKDGGQQDPISAQQSPPSAPQDPFDPPSAQRAAAPSGQTASEAAAAPVASQPTKSKLPLILGIGVAVLLAASCTVGGLWYGYTTLLADDVSDAKADHSQGGEERPDETDDSARVSADAGSSDDTAVAQTDDVSEDNNGEKAGDDEAQGGKQADEGGKAGDDETATAAKDNEDQEKEEDMRNQTGRTTKIEINAEKAEIAVNQKNKDDEDDKTKTDESTTVAKTKEEPKEDSKPKGPQGNISQLKLTGNTSYCLMPNVNSVVGRAERSFLSCYNALLESDPSVSGDIFMTWSISTDGSVLRPNVQSRDINAKSCLLGKLQRLRFDPPIGGRCTVRAQYRFSP